MAVNEKKVYPLSELKKFEVADDDPDVRGWKVISGDGKKIGEVTELLVDPDAMKVRYLDIRVNEDFQGVPKDKRLLIPIGIASLDEKEDRVYIKNIETVTILKYPQYDGSNVTREYESNIRNTLTGAPAEQPLTGDDEFYTHEHFNDQNFYGSRRKRFYRLSDLNVYDILGTNPDVRGWDALSMEWNRIGKVHEMLVDVKDRKIRYLDILLAGVDAREYPHVLIPIGLASISEKDNSIIINLEEELIKNMPVYNGGSVSRDYEYSVIRSVETGGNVPAGENDIYDHKNFDYKHFYGSAHGRS